MLTVIVAIHCHVLSLTARFDDERGQTSAEYALVLLGAAAVALLVVAWATKSNKVSQLLNAVFNKLLDSVK